MSKIEWNLPEDRSFETGLDRGVLYIQDGPTVPWNGLGSVNHGGESSVKEFFIDGIKYLTYVSPKNWAGSITAYTYPKAFSNVIGFREIAEGLYADEQLGGRFNLAYRTLVSTPDVSVKPHYKLHLFYNVVAKMSDHDYETLSDDISPTEFEFEIFTTPVVVPGIRPTSHFIVDTRYVDPGKLSILESILYGSSTADPRFPTPDELIDLLSFTDEVVVVDNGDGTWTATGSSDNIILGENGYFEIHNVDAEYITEDIYEFFGVDSPSTISIFFDTDGTPYFRFYEGASNLGIDTDSVPFAGEGENGASIRNDTDGTPYFEYH